MRIALVHRALDAVSATRHARFSGRQPPCADRSVPGHQAEREYDSGKTVDQPPHVSRMLDGGEPVKRMVFKTRDGEPASFEDLWTNLRVAKIVQCGPRNGKLLTINRLDGLPQRSRVSD